MARFEAKFRTIEGVPPIGHGGCGEVRLGVRMADGKSIVIKYTQPAPDSEYADQMLAVRKKKEFSKSSSRIFPFRWRCVKDRS